MAKINVFFNNKDYFIDESSYAAAAASLKSHLSTVMNGSGTVVNFGGVSYNIDSAKLSSAVNDLVSHFEAIAGNGARVIVNDVEYLIDPDKVKVAVSDLETVLGNLNNPDEDIDIVIVLDEAILDQSVLG